MNESLRKRIAAKDGRYAARWGLPGPTDSGDCACGGGCAKRASAGSCRCNEPAPSFFRAFDEKSLWPGAAGIRFNASIIDHEGGYLLCYRDAWSGSNLWLGRLDSSFLPVGEPWRLVINHKDAPAGREDPRLFRHRGRVCVSFSGVVNKPWHTSILYAELGDDLQVERVYSPRYRGRNLWEKNWAFFDYEDGLHAVYYAQPHRILFVAWNVATLDHVASGLENWAGGEIRGGASPVRVGEEYWHFFHDVVPDRVGVRTYRVGLYTFDAFPPFKPRRVHPEPLLVARQKERAGVRVVFPAGAVRVGDDWVVSMGVDDSRVELHRWSHESLQSKLEML